MKKDFKVMNNGECINKHQSGFNGIYNHHIHGPSSFAMHDPELVFRKLNLLKGYSFLDLGCGAGDYSIQAAKIVGDFGLVYALDIWEELFIGLMDKANSQELRNIKTIVSDISDPLPLENSCVNVCFIATVLHTLDITKDGENLFKEINRVLKPNGQLSIIECKKEDTPFGPPIHMRNSAEELESIITQYGFGKLNYIDLGYNYMIQFILDFKINDNGKRY